MRVFVDSNVLIYAHDLSEGRKRDRAAARLRELWLAREGVLSTQVLEEFYARVTGRKDRPMTRRAARQLVQSYLDWQVDPIEGQDVVRASEIQEQHGLSFWDSLIVASAVKASAARLLSEDLRHGQRIEGVVVENPFR